MELPWDLGLLSGLLESVVSFCSEFAHDWGANDMRVTIFKLLLGWLVCSLVAIHMAWKYYGATVNDMYYREWRSEWWHSGWILKLCSLGKCRWRVI
ncbi:T-cell leukemia translocation-altered gene protein homolog isoform X2 [Leucoraja erinacea]|uniref:T-cell leukemia translocation-altered gene protein homolog isoform X2 n=1 Tax=Leucoraja erinaceus TaxID=7782 RepID=UPI002455D61C|nr:T-cell leukemia translocation-altered gene protein homolog isoform X2 [Leucoraja erinacea]